MNVKEILENKKSIRDILLEEDVLSRRAEDLGYMTQYDYETDREKFMDMLGDEALADKEFMKLVDDYFSKGIVTFWHEYTGQPYVFVSNDIDGYSGNEDFMAYNSEQEALAAWEDNVESAKKNSHGEWDMALYKTSGKESDIIQKYGYYKEVSNAEKIKELSYMDGLENKEEVHV